MATPPCSSSAPGSSERFQAMIGILQDRLAEAPAEEFKRAPALGR